jgi:hypothetical protein
VTATIRPYRAGDREAVREIACDTALAGEPVELFFSDREVFADLPATTPTTSLPFHGMGGGAGLVNVWHWKADWQEDVKSFADVTNLYPGMHVDQTPFEGDPLFVTALGAGNGMAQQKRKSAVEELNATGFGSLTAQPADSQDADGLGAWADGRRRVVLRRALSTKDALRDARLGGRPSFHAAFAVWDGAAGDRDGQSR